MVGPKNFMTNPPKRGKTLKNTTFGGNFDHKADDYNAAKKITTK